MVRFLLIAALLTCSASSIASAEESVAYRLVDWKAKHIHDAKKADTIVETLTKLKCEVKREAHNGHEDVKYRCPEWTTLQLKTHDEAHKWEKWLKDYGFETEHKH